MQEEAKLDGVAAVHDISEARNFVNHHKRNKRLATAGAVVGVVAAVVIIDAVTPPVVTPLTGKFAPNKTSRHLAANYKAERKRLRAENKNHRVAEKARRAADKHIDEEGRSRNDGGEQAATEE